MAAGAVSLKKSHDIVIFRQIICWQSRGTATVMEVKLQHFLGRGSTTVVAVKNQVQLKKLRIAKFLQKWKKNFFTATDVVLPQSRKQCDFTSVTTVEPRLYQQMIWWYLFNFHLNFLLKFHFLRDFLNGSWHLTQKSILKNITSGRYKSGYCISLVKITDTYIVDFLESF